jgi:hypothetical protein
MLVICEDCAKKYNIDESRIKGNRARFTCNACGHIIIVDKADFTRSLISGQNSRSTSSSSSIDLLREMESPITRPANGGNMATQQKSAEGTTGIENRRTPFWKNRGIPIFVYFILTMLFTLLCVSLVTGYLYTEYIYSEYLADVTRKSSEYRDELLLQSSLAFGAVWIFILIVFTVIGRMMHKKFSQLVVNANQLAVGDYTISIVKNGPREVRDLAFALERIRERLQNHG